MIIKLFFSIIVFILLKIFIVKFDYKDYFNIMISLLLSITCFIYITSNSRSLIYLIFILSISLIVYSFHNNDNSDSSIIVLNGNILFKNMYKNNYSIYSLFKDIKKNNLSFIDDRLCAILENNKLVFYSKDDMVNKPISIIINGNICYKELSLIGKNKRWLRKRVEENNHIIEEIFYSFYYNNKLYIIKK